MPARRLSKAQFVGAPAEKPATTRHEGVNPFIKEPMTYKAKPARRLIRVRPLKALKDAV